MRGNLRVDSTLCSNPRSIPACAGEPPPRLANPPEPEVYPRVCGGTRWIACWRFSIEGLSPRVRGNPSNVARIVPAKGSIPACAGEPARCPWWRTACQVYPRVCGGTRPTFSFSSPFFGLSPRVRGNLTNLSGQLKGERSIPACAGEPCAAVISSWQRRVYPRVCGGTADQYAGELDISGLSPRVRGNLSRSECGRFFFGSIPACAGEPPAHGPYLPAYQVYPRVCGGTLFVAALTVITNGLSPRVRGNRRVAFVHITFTRSIPACAGEPTGSSPRTA